MVYRTWIDGLLNIFHQFHPRLTREETESTMGLAFEGVMKYMYSFSSRSNVRAKLQCSLPRVWPLRVLHEIRRADVHVLCVIISSMLQTLRSSRVFSEEILHRYSSWSTKQAVDSSFAKWLRRMDTPVFIDVGRLIRNLSPFTWTNWSRVHLLAGTFIFWH